MIHGELLCFSVLVFVAAGLGLSLLDLPLDTCEDLSISVSSVMLTIEMDN